MPTPTKIDLLGFGESVLTAEKLWDTIPYRRQLVAIQSLCLGMVGVMTFIATGFTAVVWLALDGQALAGQLYTIAGVSIITWMTGLLTPFVPLGTWWLSRSQTDTKLAEIAKSHPELLNYSTDVQRVTELFAYKTYIEYAIPTGFAFAWAIVYHIVSDSLILLWIGALLLLLLARYPSSAKYQEWMERALLDVQKRRATESK